MPRGFRSINVALATFFVLISGGRAETAMLDCVADRSLTVKAGAATELELANGILMDFQWQTVAHWRVTKATLLVHVSKGSPPVQLDVALVPEPWGDSKARSLLEKRLNFLTQKVENHPDGWIAVDLPPSVVELAAEGKAHGFVVRDRVRGKGRWAHTRRSGQYAPHLLVEGTPAIN